MTVLIAGCGDLGTEAGLRFAAAGSRVVGWRRSPQLLPAQIEGVAADLRGTLPTVPADTNVVVVAVAADSPTEEAYRAAYEAGLGNVLDALERDGVAPRRVLFVSSTAVYGDANGDWVHEETPATAASFSGRVMREAEALLHRRVPGSVALRLGGIYGPGRTRLIDQVRSGSAEIPSIPRFTNRIHRDDAAAAIVHLAGIEDPVGLYLGVDSNPAQLADVLRFLAAETGVPEPPQEAESSGGDGAVRGGNKRCSNARLLAAGFRFRFPSYVEGYRALLAGEGVRHP